MRNPLDINVNGLFDLVGSRTSSAPRLDDDSGDSRFTPLSFFQDLHARYRFTVDAAGHELAPVSKFLGRFWTIREDGLRQSWAGERVWVNPPFSKIPRWVGKARDELDAGCPLVVMLLPANRTEQPWWADVIEPIRDGRQPKGSKWTLTTTFLAGRTRYGNPEDPAGVKAGSPPFASVLLTWRRT